MKHIKLQLIVSFFILFIPFVTMALEEPKYSVLKKDQDIEIRLYDSYIAAETTVDTSDYDEASNEGFKRLAGYIFGGNKKQQKISMTSPVVTEQSQKIPLTAPAQTEQLGTSVRITFMMPSEFTLETLPIPNDSRILFRQVPSKKAAVIKFSGRWTAENFGEHTDKLMRWIEQQGLKVCGTTVVARYNPPFVPSFFRHNEIIIPVE
jgi:hypothetical protein